MMLLKVLEKSEQAKLKINIRKEIINIRAKVNEMDAKRIMQRLSERKSWFFGNINKIDKPLAKLTKERERRPIQTNKIRGKKGYKNRYH
jgi:DNA repair exonuclease SbcCD ATPase subunit